MTAFTQTSPFGYFNYRPSIGDTVSYHRIDTNSVSEGDTGLNVTWDMSKLRFFPGSEKEFFFSPSATPYGSVFPSSNIVRRDSAGLFTYFKMDSMQLEILGSVTGLDTTIWDNPRTLVRYQLGKDSIWLDSFSRMDSTFRSKKIYAGRTQTKGDGYGTLKLPTKTLSDVLRINVLIDQTNTTSDQNGTETQTERLLSWHYLTPGAKFPVISLYTLELKSGRIKYGFYTPGAITSSIVEVNRQIESLHLYPNPISEGSSLTVNLPEGTKGILRIYNLQGQMLWQKAGVAGNTSLPVNLLPTGYYRIAFRTANGIMQAPFVVR
jgi:hypothetical protein